AVVVGGGQCGGSAAEVWPARQPTVGNCVGPVEAQPESSCS
ncbi:hypothetical protein A2U01_0070765, partial [Trifolium medium]|nr:hypothetical protein [Trifolium medium]